MAAAKEFAVKAMDALEDKGHTGAIRAELAELLGRHESVVFHDDLAEINNPFYVEEFTAQAAQYGLQYLGDADLSREHGLPYRVPTKDRAQERQYADFATARRFRETLLCRAHVEVAQSIELDRLLGLWAGSKAEVGAGQADGTQTFMAPGRKKMTT